MATPKQNISIIDSFLSKISNVYGAGLHKVWSVSRLIKDDIRHKFISKYNDTNLGAVLNSIIYSAFLILIVNN